MFSWLLFLSPTVYDQEILDKALKYDLYCYCSNIYMYFDMVQGSL